MSKISRRLNPATVIAVIALVFALGGTAVAAKRYLITNTQQISPAVLKQLAKLAAKQGTKGTPGSPGSPGASGSPGAPGSSGERGPAGPGAVVYWAVVNADGGVAREGTSGVETEKIDTGTYVVKFEGPVDQCAYEAAIGLSKAESTETPGLATVVARNSEPRGVLVQTFDLGGGAQDRGFHLAVFC